MEREFIRVRSVKDIIVSSLLIVSGCILVALPTSTAVNIAGFFLCITGLLLAFIMKTAYKDSISGEKFAKKERFFSHEKLDMLKSSLTCPDKIDLSKEDNGSSIRLDIYHNKTKVYVQLFEYIPHSYEPCSAMHEHAYEKANKMLGK